MRFPISYENWSSQNEKRYSEEQIIRVIKRHEAGAKVEEICRGMGIYPMAPFITGVANTQAMK